MRLSGVSLLLLGLLGAWFGLNFIGAPGVVSREPIFSLAGVMLGLVAAFALMGLLGLRYAAALWLIALLVWAFLQIETHWSTYFFVEASEKKAAWYARTFGGNWRFLPVIEGRTTPDGYHAILGALILANIGAAIRDTVRRSPEHEQ